MSFVDILPFELIEQIFDYSLPRITHTQLQGLSPPIDAHVPSFHEAPVSLSLVSKNWRYIALQLPLLWNSIAIIVPSYPKEGAHTLLQNYLDRSGSLGLTIRLRSFDLLPPTLALFELICNHASRWEHIDFEVDGHFFNSRPLLSLLDRKETYASLKSIGMLSADVRSDRHGASAMIDLANLLDRSPNCNAVRWGGPSEVMLNYELLPWDRFQSVEFHNLLTVPQLYILFNLCENLRTLNARYLVAQGLRANAFPETMTMNSLTGISFHGSVLGQLKIVLDRLILPSLEHLHVSTDAWSNLSDFGILSLITRSECSLKSLRLRNVHLPPEALETILKTSPGLSSLSLTSAEVTIDDRLIDLMTPQPDSPETLIGSNLRTLQLVNTCVQVEDGKLSSLLSSRDQVIPFDTLQISMPARVAARYHKDRLEFGRYRSADSRIISFETMAEETLRGQRGNIPRHVT